MAEQTAVRNALLIHNPVAGWPRWKRQRDLRRAREILAEAGIEVALAPTGGPGSASELARRSVAEGRELVIVCGGDGTINEAVQGLAGSRVPLGILPAGTANVLAKELGLPWNIARAARLIPQSHVVRISLGRAGERYFISLAGAGPDGAIVYRLGRWLKFNLGIAAYWLEGVRHLFSYDFPRFAVEACGQKHEAIFVVVSKTRHYGGPFRITRRARLVEDAFEVAVFHPAGRWRFLSYILADWLGRLERSRELTFLRARSARCAALDPATRIYVETDGEPAGRLPREFVIVPDALSLLVPPTYREATHG